MRNRVEIFLEDMTYNTRFEFLEAGKDTEELMSIAEKRGIRLPSHDLSIFKGRYAFIDRMNLNNCTLPREEVESALDTLNGKAIDFDHYRKNVVGHWVDAEIVDDEIIAYGVFFKSNFQEDYATIQELMEKDVLAISFEAWGDRDMREDGTYNLRDIEFAGGALLIKTKPAFPGSEVMEMANKGKILEMAKVLTPPSNFIHTGDIKRKIVFSSKDEKINDHKDHFPINTEEQARSALVRASQYDTAPKWYNGSLTEVVEKIKAKVKEEYPNMEISEELPESARFYLYDIESILRLCSQVDCTECNETGFSDIDMIDFKNNKAKIKCINCESEMELSLTPTAKLSKKGRKITQVSKIDHDSAQVTAGDNKDNVGSKTTKEAEQSMKKLLEKYEVDSVEKLVQALAKATLERELSEDELNLAYTLIEYKAGGGAVNSTSLMSLKGKTKSTDYTMVDANLSEEDMTSLISEIAKNTIEEAKVKAEKAVEEAKIAEEAKVVEEKRKAEEAKAAEDIEKAKEMLTAKDVEIAELKAKIDSFEAAQKEAEERVKAELINTRKDELGEFGKDLSDDDILNEDKFTIAKQTKMIEELKAGTKLENAKVKPVLSKGSIDKDSTEDTEKASRQKIRDLAWSSDEEK